MTKQEEIKLALQAQQDICHLEPLYEKYFSVMMGFVYRRVLDQKTTEDLVSEVWEKVIKNIASFEDKGYGFSAWLYRIANNCVVDYFRSQKKMPVLALDDIPPQASSLDNPHETLLAIEHEEEKMQAIGQLMAAVRSLSTEEQLIVSLKFFEKKKNTEIADIVGCSANNLGVKIHRILGHLRKLYLPGAEVQHV